MTALPTNNIIPYQAPASPAISTWRGVQPGDFDSAIRMAQAIALSGMAPRSYYPDKEPDPERRQKIATAAVFSAMQLGAEVGLSPMTAVRSIAVINGLPGLYGPAMLGVVEASGKLADIDEGVTGEGLERHGWCTVQRVGRKPRTFKFSMEDAKKARLIGKPGPWTEYPDRMLLARARTFALRDVFPDVLLGLAYSAEELADIPAEQARDVTPPKAEPPAPQPPKLPKPAIRVKVPGQAAAEFSQDDGLEPALRAALAFMSDGILDGRGDVVAANNPLLDRIAERLPEMADAVAELRAAAVMAEHMTPPGDAEPDGFVQHFVNPDGTDRADHPKYDDYDDAP
jgi:hypothetical protein